MGFNRVLGSRKSTRGNQKNPSFIQYLRDCGRLVILLGATEKDIHPLNKTVLELSPNCIIYVRSQV
jgi:hypothetical protein